MARGRFSAPRRRPSPVSVFFRIIFLVILVVAGIFLYKSFNQEKTGETTAPTIQTTQTTPTETTAAPTTQPTTVPPTEATTAPTTVPTTVPVTEPVTETTTVATEPTGDSDPDEQNTLGQNIAALAKTTVGKPYVKGGVGPDGFDTSGLVTYCYKENGIAVSNNTAKLFASGVEVAKEELQPGDVVFFYLNNPGKAEYVGIYTGEDTFVAVSTSKNLVMERSMTSSYYTEHFVGARRYTPQ